MHPPDSDPTTLDERVRAGSAARRADRRHTTKQAILDAATELFEAEDSDAFSLRQVAAAIGYSATTIYNYFEDKDELLYYVVMEGFAAFGERLQAAYDAGADPLDRLSRLGEAYIRFGLDKPLHYRLMFMDRNDYMEREAPAGAERVIDSFGILRATVAECVEAGHFPDLPLDELAMQVWSGVHGLVALGIATEYLDEPATLEMSRLSNRILIHGMGALARGDADG